MGDITLLKRMQARASEGDSTILHRLRRSAREKLALIFGIKPKASESPKNYPIDRTPTREEGICENSINLEDTYVGPWEFPDETVVIDPIAKKSLDINTEDISVHTQFECSCNAKSYVKGQGCFVCNNPI